MSGKTQKIDTGRDWATGSIESRVKEGIIIVSQKINRSRPLGLKSVLPQSCVILAALLGLALFDAVATFGTVANAALAGAPDAAAPSMSVMEAVARSIRAQPGWEREFVDAEVPAALAWLRSDAAGEARAASIPFGM